MSRTSRRKRNASERTTKIALPQLERQVLRNRFYSG